MYIYIYIYICVYIYIYIYIHNPHARACCLLPCQAAGQLPLPLCGRGFVANTLRTRIRGLKLYRKSPVDTPEPLTLQFPLESKQTLKSRVLARIGRILAGTGPEQAPRHAPNNKITDNRTIIIAIIILLTMKLLRTNNSAFHRPPDPIPLQTDARPRPGLLPALHPDKRLGTKY